MRQGRPGHSRCSFSMPFNVHGYHPYQVDPESLLTGNPSSVRRAVANLAFAGARAGARGLKRRFVDLAMSQGDNVAVAALSAASSVGAGEVSKIARTVAQDVGGIPVEVRANLLGRTRALFGRLGGRRAGRATRRPRFNRRTARRYTAKRRRTSRYASRRSRYSRRRYY